MHKYYAIKRPDGSWIILSVSRDIIGAWGAAIAYEPRLLKVATDSVRPVWVEAEALGYRCVEVCGFQEVQDG